MENLIKNKKMILIAMAIIFCVGIIIFVYFYNQNNSDTNFESTVAEGISENNDTQLNDKKEEEKQQEKQQENDEEIYIHITGEIKNEGVITLKKGSRIIDAIEKAGGVTENADLSKINLVYILSDGQKLVIPKQNANNNEPTITSEGGTNIIQSEVNDKSKKININTATQTELETITGVGPSLAGKIIEYRKKNGKFKSKEDVKNVTGIGESKYETIKELIDI